MNRNLVEEIQVNYYRVWNRVYRSLSRRHVAGRVTSWPFLACDTYAGESSLVLNLDRNCDPLLQALEQRDMMRSWYVSRKNVERLHDILKKREPVKRSRYLVLGDSDQSIESADLIPLTVYFDFIFSTNLIDENPNFGIFGLPMGLENKSYVSSGLLNSYIQIPRFNVEDRKLGILVSWNDETHLPYRSEVRLSLSRSESAKVVERRVPFQMIHRFTRSSLMVACPRGNGFDTHRIWESLYLGALPVITKNDYLPVFAKWPIYVVDSWESLAAMKRNELERIYGSYTNSLVSFRSSAREFMEGVFCGS